MAEPLWIEQATHRAGPTQRQRSTRNDVTALEDCNRRRSSRHANNRMSAAPFCPWTQLPIQNRALIGSALAHPSSSLSQQRETSRQQNAHSRARADACPGGTLEISRWLTRSGYHRNPSKKPCTPMGCQNSAPSVPTLIFKSRFSTDSPQPLMARPRVAFHDNKETRRSRDAPRGAQCIRRCVAHTRHASQRLRPQQRAREQWRNAHDWRQS